MVRVVDADEYLFAALLAKSADYGTRELGWSALADALVLKVGPKGYVHGWIKVGPGVKGDIVHHPEHGRGVVTRVGKKTTAVRFDSGAEHSFDHAPKGTRRKHFVEREPAAPKPRKGKPAATRGAPDVGRMSDAELADHFHDLSTQDRPDEAHLSALLDEMDRRQAVAGDPGHRIDVLVSKGVPYHEAYAEVHGLDPAELDRQARNALVDTARRAGETREDTARRLYAEHVHHQLLAAEHATSGHLLSPEGQAKGIHPATLFSGDVRRARKYGSEDLHRFWAGSPRHTYTEFRAGLFGRKRDREAAAAGRLRGNGRDFGV